MNGSKLLSIQCIALLIIVCAYAANGQVIQGGRCPAVPTVEDFQVEKYGGTWYEYARYPFVFEALGKCTTAEYGLLDNGNVTVKNTQQNSITGIITAIEGTARVIGSGKLVVRFDGFAGLLGEANYWILDTDYVNYAVVYSCNQLGGIGLLHTDVLWILTRSRTPSPEIIQTAKDVITRNQFSLTPLQVTEQRNC